MAFDRFEINSLSPPRVTDLKIANDEVRKVTESNRTPKLIRFFLSHSLSSLSTTFRTRRAAPAK